MTTYYSNNSGSGYFGMGGVKPQRYLFCRTDSSGLPSNIVSSSGVWYGQGKYGNFQFGNPNLGYNFLEDFKDLIVLVATINTLQVIIISGVIIIIVRCFLHLLHWWI